MDFFRRLTAFRCFPYTQPVTTTKSSAIDPHATAADLQQWNPLHQLDASARMRDVVKEVLGSPAKQQDVLERARETFIDGIASVLHLVGGESDEYLEHLARKSMEAEDQVLARKHPVNIGIVSQEGLSRLVFLPVGTTQPQYDRYKEKLRKLAEKLAMEAVTPALRDLSFVGNMQLPFSRPVPGKEREAARRMRTSLTQFCTVGDPRLLLESLGASLQGEDRTKWEQVFVEEMQKRQPSLDID